MAKRVKGRLRGRDGRIEPSLFLGDLEPFLVVIATVGACHSAPFAQRLACYWARERALLADIYRAFGFLATGVAAGHVIARSMHMAARQKIKTEV
jgi:hypothetical protein